MEEGNFRHIGRCHVSGRAEEDVGLMGRMP